MSSDRPTQAEPACGNRFLLRRVKPLFEWNARGTMNAGWAVAGAVAGLLVGVPMRGVVVRLSVPAGEPARATCPRCSAPLPRLAAVRCGSCRAPLGPFPLLELTCGATVCALAWRFAGTPEVA